MDTGRLDTLLGRLDDRKDAWAQLAPEKRARYFRQCIRGVEQVAPAWVADACRHRSIDPESALAGEEWLSGPAVTVRGLRLTAEALEQSGAPALPGAPHRVTGGWSVPVFPATVADRVLYRGMSAEVRVLPGAEITQGRIYRERRDGNAPEPAVAVVLGAGNISSIAPLDVAHELAATGRVVALKMNPVNEYLGPHLERAFRPLIDEGFLAIAYGGADVGDYLCRHPLVGAIHLTGAGSTFDAIVWGSDAEERESRKRHGTPRIDKPMTAELGCVTPILVVPGDWTDADVRFQARHVAAMVAHNASHNCNAGKVLVTARNWALRARFVDAVRDALAGTPPRVAYYPGADDRYESFLDAYPQAEVLGATGDRIVPWTLIPDVPANPGEVALRTEAFCGVLAEVPLDAGSAEDFLERAVAFVNRDVAGTLSCAVLVKPSRLERERAALERAIDGLRYGAVAVNVWPGVVFGLGSTPWGAYPGNTLDDVGSGIGVVHNTFLLDLPEKTVMRAPFRLWPTPVWFAGHRTLDRLGRHLTAFEGRRTPWALAGILWAGLRG